MWYAGLLIATVFSKSDNPYKQPVIHAECKHLGCSYSTYVAAPDGIFCGKCDKKAMDYSVFAQQESGLLIVDTPLMFSKDIISFPLTTNQTYIAKSIKANCQNENDTYALRSVFVLELNSSLVNSGKFTVRTNPDFTMQREIMIPESYSFAVDNGNLPSPKNYLILSHKYMKSVKQLDDDDRVGHNIEGILPSLRNSDGRRPLDFISIVRQGLLRGFNNGISSAHMFSFCKEPTVQQHSTFRETEIAREAMALVGLAFTELRSKYDFTQADIQSYLTEVTKKVVAGLHDRKDRIKAECKIAAINYLNLLPIAEAHSTKI